MLIIGVHREMAHLNGAGLEGGTRSVLGAQEGNCQVGDHRGGQLPIPAFGLGQLDEVLVACQRCRPGLDEVAGLLFDVMT